jgi:hypothetical protein
MYLDGIGQRCGSSRQFDAQEDAEDWLRDAWPKLAASGIREVELVEGKDQLYRMSLELE